MNLKHLSCPDSLGKKEAPLQTYMGQNILLRVVCHKYPKDKCRTEGETVSTEAQKSVFMPEDFAHELRIESEHIIFQNVVFAI